MKKSAKKAVSLTLASVMTLSLAACSGKQTSESAPAANGESSGDTVELKFSWWGGDTRHEATEKHWKHSWQNIQISR